MVRRDGRAALPWKSEPAPKGATDSGVQRTSEAIQRFSASTRRITPPDSRMRHPSKNHRLCAQVHPNAARMQAAEAFDAGRGGPSRSRRQVRASQGSRRLAALAQTRSMILALSWRSQRENSARHPEPSRPGTERVVFFGAASEEVTADRRAQEAAALGFTPAQPASRASATDAQQKSRSILLSLKPGQQGFNHC